MGPTQIYSIYCVAPHVIIKTLSVSVFGDFVLRREVENLNKSAIHLWAKVEREPTTNIQA